MLTIYSIEKMALFRVALRALFCQFKDAPFDNRSTVLTAVIIVYFPIQIQYLDNARRTTKKTR